MKPIAQQRYVIIDLLRGIAMLCMIIYHFSYDLFLFGKIEIQLQHDFFWIGLRWFIVGLFLLLVGISLQLAHSQQFVFNKFSRRLAYLLACAVLVSIGSAVMFAERFIYFGILHFILLASLIAVWFRRFYYLNLIIGVSALILGNLIQHPLFNPKYFNWLGFVTEQPATEDYVPLFPWLGVVFIGLFIGRWLQQKPALLNSVKPNRWHQPLCFLGQHGLWVYMLHQPILLGLLYLFIVVLG